MRSDPIIEKKTRMALFSLSDRRRTLCATFLLGF